MKRLILSLAVVTMVIGASAKVVKTNIKVNGQQPKAKIEAAAKAVPGVRSADYMNKTKNLAVAYENKQTSPEKIRKGVMKVDVKKAPKKGAPKKKCPGKGKAPKGKKPSKTRR